MFLHELSRRIAESWHFRVDGEEYENLVRKWFNNQCPYCCRPLTDGGSVVEHLDGMNRYRAGLHVAGNVLVACRKCNGEKRRDDSARTLSLAESGWASFLSHDGTRCTASCLTCRYWSSVWGDEAERKTRMSENSERIRSFRAAFPEFERILPVVREALPELLTKLYSDCQSFAESEIGTLLEGLERILDPHVPRDLERGTRSRTHGNGKVVPLSDGPAASTS
ncbi:MAG: HNH endonuclease [Bryobacteraceae bacterium]